MSKKSSALVSRVKKLMQEDEDVGRIQQGTPAAVAHAVEVLIERLVQGAANVASGRNDKLIGAAHLKEFVVKEPSMDFLTSIVASAPELAEKKETPAKRERKPRQKAEKQEDDLEAADSPGKKPGRGGRGRGRGRGRGQAAEDAPGEEDTAGRGRKRARVAGGRGRGRGRSKIEDDEGIISSPEKQPKLEDASDLLGTDADGVKQEGLEPAEVKSEGTRDADIMEGLTHDKSALGLDATIEPAAAPEIDESKAQEALALLKSQQGAEQATNPEDDDYD